MSHIVAAIVGNLRVVCGIAARCDQCGRERIGKGLAIRVADESFTHPHTSQERRSASQLGRGRRIDIVPRGPPAMVAQEETSIARGGVSDQTTAGDVGAVVDQIIKEGRPIDRVKFPVRIIQSEHFAIDEAIPDDLSIVCRFIGGTVGSIV